MNESDSAAVTMRRRIARVLGSHWVSEPSGGIDTGSCATAHAACGSPSTAGLGAWLRFVAMSTRPKRSLTTSD